MNTPMPCATGGSDRHRASICVLQTYAANPNAGFHEYAFGAGLAGGFGALSPMGGFAELGGTLYGGGIEYAMGGKFFGTGMQIGGLIGGFAGGGLDDSLRYGWRKAGVALAWQGGGMVAGAGAGYYYGGNVQYAMLGANLGQMAGGVAHGVWSRYGARMSVSADMEGIGRNGGEVLDDAQLAKLRKYLRKRGVTLVQNADPLLPAATRGRFEVDSNGAAAILLRRNATRYEALHELQHFIDYRRLGFDRYKALGRLGSEQSVYDVLRQPRRWARFTQQERDHAYMYILMLGGNPMGSTGT